MPAHPERRRIRAWEELRDGVVVADGRTMRLETAEPVTLQPGDSMQFTLPLCEGATGYVVVQHVSILERMRARCRGALAGRRGPHVTLEGGDRAREA